MIISLMTVYLLIFFSILILQRFAPKWLSFLKLQNFLHSKDPEPIEGEYLSDFKFRKLSFMFISFLFVLALFFISYLLQHFIKAKYFHEILLAISFLFMLACVVSIFSNLAFLVSWLRTKFFGPNPKCDYYHIESFYE